MQENQVSLPVENAHVHTMLACRYHLFQSPQGDGLHQG